MSSRKNQVSSEVRRAASRHAAGNLWPPRPRIHVIFLRPSSTFTMFAISNVCGVAAVFVASTRYVATQDELLQRSCFVEVAVEHERLYLCILCG